MKKLLFVCFTSAMLILVVCSRKEPIYQVHFKTSEHQLNMKEMERVIVKSANDEGWTVKRADEGKLVAEHIFRNHKAVVDIQFAPDNFSIFHNESEKLMFDGQEIHKAYNQLVRKLENRIDQNIQGAVYGWD